ncbi:39S ribosomal protein L44, mitochondrial isoform X2 [Scaptodrosophila lebanonensis]|uniref:Large ribosomal subunit protein mL44 n=1 Tax=Drosophila lebanonensis TaxID=7225 RepID=A0A6J2TKY2_DROLE|nr:39S ribosomal protein L44, mitochondrial isoform X2 [Scaptodrosophila lebanonensis]
MSFLRSVAGIILVAKPLTSIAQTQRNIKRWVAPTLRELRHRAKKQGPQKPESRSGYVEWNYRSELFAFGKRLQESFQLPVLQAAFTQPSYVHQERERQRKLGIEEVDLQATDNTELAAKGAHIAKAYVEAYLQHSLPKMPSAGQQAIAAYLLSDNTLAYVALHLGTKELIFSAEYPPTTETLAQTLQAVIGALSDSSGVERAFIFVRDFVCTQLNQKDLLDLWKPSEPIKLLTEVCQQRNLGDVEPRLLGDCGKNTVLAAYHVGIYANRQLLGKGFGEDVNTATETAALDALQTLFDMHDNRQPFNFQLQVEPKNVRLA